VIKEAEASHTALTPEQQQYWVDNLFAWIRDVGKTPIVKGCENIRYDPTKFLFYSQFCYEGELFGALNRRFRELAWRSGRKFHVLDQNLDDHADRCIERLMLCLASIKDPTALSAFAQQIFHRMGHETQHREIAARKKETSFSSMQTNDIDNDLAEFLTIFRYDNPSYGMGLESEIIKQEEIERRQFVVQRALQFIDRLEAGKRTIVLLRLEGYSVKDIACDHGMLPNTVSQKLKRTLKDMAKYALTEE